ncbi:hypothetical protein Trydic_g3746 [Trypoxylus dichotomus]
MSLVYVSLICVSTSAMLAGWNQTQVYFLKSDMLYKLKDGKELLVIPDDMQIDIVKMVHKRNHFGKKKTEDVIRQHYYIPKLNDVIAIKRTQERPGLKLKSKYLGPYKITRVKPKDTYEVVKIGACNGPVTTTACAEFIKPWARVCDNSSE